MEELRFLILFTIIDNRMILHIETNWNCHRPQNVQQKYRLVCSFIVHTCGTKQFESILDCKPLKVSTVCQLPPRCCLIKQAFNHIYLPITQWETAVAITKNKPLFLIPNSILLFPHVTLHLFLMLLCLSLSLFLSVSFSYSLCLFSSGLPRFHLSHLQWKHPNLQMLSINHLCSNYNPINLCFHTPCCRTASALPTQSHSSDRDRQRDREEADQKVKWDLIEEKICMKGKDLVDRQIDMLSA